jgi:hypothetical protein
MKATEKEINQLIAFYWNADDLTKEIEALLFGLKTYNNKKYHIKQLSKILSKNKFLKSKLFGFAKKTLNHNKIKRN